MKRAGFTLVELLVVIAIIGVLISLLLPAVQGARESARSIQCRNHLRQMGLAMHMYMNQHSEQLPPASPFLFGKSSGADGPTGYSWRALLLPFLEQQALYDSIDFKKRPGEGSNAQALAMPVGLFQCPSSPSFPIVYTDFRSAFGYKLQSPAAGCDYVGIRQIWKEASDTQWAGAFGITEPGLKFGEIFRKEYTAPASIGAFVDGLSNTAVAFEQVCQRVHRHGAEIRTAEQVCSWLALDEADPVYMKVNFCSKHGFYSFHPGAASVLMGDAAVRRIVTGTDEAAALAMLTREQGDNPEDAAKGG